MKRILVVCEGNICRSPMAQALLATNAPALGVRSAGLGALVGRPADPIATRLMAERGIDISGHRGTQITRSLCMAADVILVMEESQRKRLEERYPEVRGRVFRLHDNDIPDPYRKREEAFRAAVAAINAGTQAWTRKLQEP